MYEMGKREFFYGFVIGLDVLAVVEERVEVRLFWRVPRMRLAYVEILGESESKQPQASPLESIGCFVASNSVAMPWLTDRRIDDE